MTKILITGGTGFIGDMLTPKLVSLGFEVICFTRDSYKARARHLRVAKRSIVEKLHYIENLSDISFSPDILP